MARPTPKSEKAQRAGPPRVLETWICSHCETMVSARPGGPAPHCPYCAGLPALRKVGVIRDRDL